jgi:hypothetical protein
LWRPTRARARRLARISLWLDEKPVSLIASVLACADAPAMRSAQRELEAAALDAIRDTRCTKRNEVGLSNSKADTRDQRVRHVTGRQRSAR